MAYKTCPDCGSRIFEHGCVNCNEADYISMQDPYVPPRGIITTKIEQLKQTIMEPICTGCNKTPDQIPEYIEGAREAKTTPAEFVKSEEGTYNKTNGHFLCTDCYIANTY